MSSEPLSPWDALTRPLFFLGRPVEGAFEVVLLSSDDGTLAPLFTTDRAGHPFLTRAPEGIELQTLAADDLRAKEEWLRASLDQGATMVAFDPDPRTLGPRAALGAEKALAYVISHRRASACL